jgi:D-alanyl-D-alanine dipeptidase
VVHVDPVLEMKDSMEVSGMSEELLQKYAQIGLVPISDNRIVIELAYAGENNFMKMQLYDTIDRVFLQKEVVERLYKCQDFLDSIEPGYRLKVYDGVRPLLVQREMWDALDTVPMRQRGKFVSNPLMGSVHNFGSAVDITIVDSRGVELDMGAGYDDFRQIAFPSLEKQFLESDELAYAAYKNRLLLRRVMRSQRFYNIPSEWWHFNAFTRPVAESKFEILLDESGHHKHWEAPKLKPKDSLEIEEPDLEGEEL